jgi:murein DD-endopeptidase MepM/ murein hydrolase activator NlpD
MHSRGIIIVVVGVALAAFWSLPELERTRRHSQLVEASSEQTPINPASRSSDGAKSETIAARAQSLFMTPLTRLLDHSIQRGETLASILSHYGAPKAQASQLLNQITSTLKSEPKLLAGQKLNVEVDASGNLIEMRGAIAPDTALEIQRGLDGELRFAMQHRASAEQVRVVNGSIDSTFAGAALDQGVPYEVIDEVVDLFGGRVEFSRSIQPGDSFVIKYIERRTFDGEELSPGPVLAASLRNNGKSLAAIRYETAPRKFQYYDENGEALGNYFLRYPLKFTRISSMFTKSRFHPVLQRNRPHNGVDFAAPIGTPVRSVAPGVITKAGWLNGGGNTVRIKHSDRWTTEYMHLSSISKGIKPGASVSRGQVIGAVGMTGLSTGPHLHFGLFDRGVYVNPLGSAAPRTGSEAKMPAQQLRAMLELLEGQHQLARVQTGESPAAHSS